MRLLGNKIIKMRQKERRRIGNITNTHFTHVSGSEIWLRNTTVTAKLLSRLKLKSEEVSKRRTG
jgi:hypothetical protein